MNSKTLFLSLSLTAALSCHQSRAEGVVTNFTPQNPPEMQPLGKTDSPAFQAMRHLQRGANLGDYLESYPVGKNKVTVSAEDFAAMRREGFDHVRIPVGWQHYAGPGPDFMISPEIFAKADPLVTNSLANGLSVIINIHHFDELDRDPTATTAEFLQIWKQVAEHYKDCPGGLVFELDNEPHQQATTAVMNPIYAQAISLIRESNPRRTIMVEPGKWGGIDELQNLIVPADDNVVVSVHCYNPFLFTHQGASWTHGSTPLTGLVFPGPPSKPYVPDPGLNLPKKTLQWVEEYNTLPTEKNPSGPIAFTSRMKFLHDWQAHYGRPIHLGEFGAYTKGDQQSRANYYSALRHAAEAQGIGWCIWDWNSGFRYWDEKTQQPLPGMREALFGK